MVFAYIPSWSVVLLCKQVPCGGAQCFACLPVKHDPLKGDLNMESKGFPCQGGAAVQVLFGGAQYFACLPVKHDPLKGDLNMESKGFPCQGGAAVQLLFGGTQCFACLPVKHDPLKGDLSIYSKSLPCQGGADVQYRGVGHNALPACHHPPGKQRQRLRFLIISFLCSCGGRPGCSFGGVHRSWQSLRGSSCDRGSYPACCGMLVA